MLYLYFQYDWWTANYACKSKGMVLANIQTELEHEAVRQGLGNYDL
jgi:hypothetical protein